MSFKPADLFCRAAYPIVASLFLAGDVSPALARPQDNQVGTGTATSAPTTPNGSDVKAPAGVNLTMEIGDFPFVADPKAAGQYIACDYSRPLLSYEFVTKAFEFNEHGSRSDKFDLIKNSPSQSFQIVGDWKLQIGGQNTVDIRNQAKGLCAELNKMPAVLRARGESKGSSVEKRTDCFGKNSSDGSFQFIRSYYVDGKQIAFVAGRFDGPQITNPDGTIIHDPSISPEFHESTGFFPNAAFYHTARACWFWQKVTAQKPDHVNTKETPKIDAIRPENLPDINHRSPLGTSAALN